MPHRSATRSSGPAHEPPLGCPGSPGHRGRPRSASCHRPASAFRRRRKERQVRSGGDGRSTGGVRTRAEHRASVREPNPKARRMLREAALGAALRTDRPGGPAGSGMPGPARTRSRDAATPRTGTPPAPGEAPLGAEPLHLNSFYPITSPPAPRRPTHLPPTHGWPAGRGGGAEAAGGPGTKPRPALLPALREFVVGGRCRWL